MKKADFISAIVALSVLTATTPAAALGLNASLGTDVRLEQGSASNATVNGNSKVNAKNDHSVPDNRWSNWMFNTGIAGTVTAVSGDTITVRGSNNTVYTVDADNAKIRGTAGIDSTADIKKGDRILIQGVVDDTNVVATLIIDARNDAPVQNDDEKRSGIAGTVTAKSGTTLTVIGKNGTSYKVDASDATVWKNKSESSLLSSIAVGDSVAIQGDVSGSSVVATRIYAVTIPQSSANGGIRGTVTAVEGDTITLLASGGTTYTVDASDADVEDRKGKEVAIDDIDVGESIVVQGDVSGSRIDADVVSEAKVGNGFFYRFGLFWKNLFGKKNT